jgi:Xaa-Pro aminopeptidase
VIRCDIAGRLPRLREAMAAGELPALLVTNLVNIRYLTGFTGSAAMLLVLPDSAVFFTDGRYRDQSAQQLRDAGVEARIEVGLSAGAQFEALSASAAGIDRLGLEAHAVTWAQQRSFASERFPHAELIPTEDLVERLRLVKDEGEIARIAEAARIADDALGKVKPMLLDGATEQDVAIALDFEMRRGGASGPSFDTIVASGPNGAKPHHRPGDRRIREGDLVVIDFGAIIDGYCSDMTRTVSVGEPTSETARRMVEVVTESQAAGVAAVIAGTTAKDVDEACRRVIADAGWADAFLHGTGHGVGLEIHEAPRVSFTSADTLTAGQVVTVEPGVYLPEHGGVRIEDTVVVTADGCWPLTNATKDLVLS